MEMAAFVASAQFAGPRANYVFTTRESGTGYYLEASTRGRPRDEEGPPTKKRFVSGGVDGEEPSVEEILRRGELVEVSEMDSEAAKRLLLQLEKRMLVNRELRVKYADDPRRFVDSEVDLDEAIKELSLLASAPEVYEVVVACDGAQSLASLLSHENGDVRASTLGLIRDLLDPESAEGTEGGLEGTRTLAAALIKTDIVELAAANLERFDETSAEESQATHDALGLLEHLCELDSSWATESWRRAPDLARYLVERVAAKGFDANKLYASEVLAIAVQRSDANARRLGDDDGALLDRLLTAANYYRRRSPADADEEECLENVFDALYAALAVPANVPFFVKAEGVELMVRCAREGRHAAACALKVLDAALSSIAPSYDDACAATRLVASAGLKVVFPALVGKGAARPPKLDGVVANGVKNKKTRRAKRHADDQRQTDERAVALVASLCFYAVPTAPEDALPRIVAKFAEPGKIGHLLDLVDRYSADVRVQRKIEADLLHPDASEADRAASHARVLRTGGHALRLAAVALAFALAHSPACRAAFAQKRPTPSLGADLAQLLVEYADELDEREDSDDDDATTRATARVAELRAGALRNWAAALAALGEASS